MEENKLVLDTHVGVSIFHKNREVDLIDAIPAKSLLLISCEEQLKEFKHIATTNDKVKQMLSSKLEQYIQFIRGITQLSESESNQQEGFLRIGWLVNSERRQCALAKLSLAPHVRHHS